MAFHVTYWDYIGWQDRFASKQYDQRQRQLAQKNNSKMVYTPQFVLAGQDYKSYSTFSDDVNKLVMQRASVDLELSTWPDEKNTDQLVVKLNSDMSRSQVKHLALYFAVIENDLSSDVSDGENEGEKLHHNYVVRALLGPYRQIKAENSYERKLNIALQPEWKKADISIVAFAENPDTGEVLQAVRLKY